AAGTIYLRDVNGAQAPQVLRATMLAGDATALMSTIGNASFRPGAKQFAVAGPEAAVTIYDLTTQRIETLRGHPLPVRWIAWRPDGQQLASGGDDGVARIWDVAGG